MLDGSPALEAGIQAGDEIETVDGTPAGEIGLSDAAREAPHRTAKEREARAEARGEERVTVAMKTRRMI